jgi:hypothetical protein
MDHCAQPNPQASQNPPALPGGGVLYRLRLLRYAPNRLSDEFYNIAALVYDEHRRLLDARFTPDFVRLRANPLADLRFLLLLKEDFENRRLLGEGFDAYVEDLLENLSQGLQISEEKSFLGGAAGKEMERLVDTYLATPRRSELRAAGPQPDTRRWVLAKLRDALRLHGLAERLQADVSVGAAVSPRFSFRIDYAYKPNGKTHYIQALSLRRDLNDAGRLCFVFDRLRSQIPAALTAVVPDILPEDTWKLLESSDIRPWRVSQVGDLALSIRQDLQLS